MRSTSAAVGWDVGPAPGEPGSRFAQTSAEEGRTVLRTSACTGSTRYRLATPSALRLNSPGTRKYSLPSLTRIFGRTSLGKTGSLTAALR